MLGALSMFDDAQKKPLQKNVDFSDPEGFGDSGSYTTCGGGHGGSGGGDAPG